MPSLIIPETETITLDTSGEEKKTTFQDKIMMDMNVPVKRQREDGNGLTTLGKI